jgi:hypothetical protein
MDNYIPLNENAIRQQIDSSTVFEEYARAASDARRVRGGMYWKKQGKYEYLVKTQPDGRQKRVGPRSIETESTYERFTTEKHAAEERLAALKAAVGEAERLNKALRVGHAPKLLVSILNVLEHNGLSAHFTVIGTHALYAYEAVAGVRFASGAIAAQDVDMLWDAGKSLEFFAEIEKCDTSTLKLLQKVDSSFRHKDTELSTIVNNHGFEVAFLQRGQQSNDLSDVFVVQARCGSLLMQAKTFSQVIASTTGKMAVMRTVDPVVFVQYKEWMSFEAPDRPAMKRRRDLIQAHAVRRLLDEQRLLPA